MKNSKESREEGRLVRPNMGKPQVAFVFDLLLLMVYKFQCKPVYFSTRILAAVP